MTRFARWAVALTCTATLFANSSAHAGGLFVTDRGVRPLGRGGAFVAGADDVGAIWYNPAGLADAGTSILADFSWVNYSVDFTRRSNVTTAGGTVQTVDFPQVSGSSSFVPLPTIAGSYNFGPKKEFTAAAGIFAPYAGLMTYPTEVNGRPAPSRYSLVSQEGSALVTIGGYFAYKPIEQFRVGGGVQVLAGKFDSTVVFGAGPNDRVIGAPEDPQYDAFSKLSVGPIIAPSANFGMTAVPTELIRIGASVQLPFWINAPASVDVRLPTAAPFDKARQEGNKAEVRFRLPLILRAGVELRTKLSDTSALRVEAAYVREFWSMHDTIDIRSENMKLYDIAGFPSPFGVAPISMPRNFQDSNSFRLGGEYSLKAGEHWVDLRGGASYETSAVPTAWVSPFTYDANKVILSVGGGLHLGENWRLDAMGSIALIQSTTVDPNEAGVPRVNPVRGNPTATEAVNGGEYSASAFVLGLGANYKF